VGGSVARRPVGRLLPAGHAQLAGRAHRTGGHHAPYDRAVLREVQAAQHPAQLHPRCLQEPLGLQGAIHDATGAGQGAVHHRHPQQRVQGHAVDDGAARRPDDDALAVSGLEDCHLLER